MSIKMHFQCIFIKFPHLDLVQSSASIPLQRDGSHDNKVSTEASTKNKFFYNISCQEDSFLEET